MNTTLSDIGLHDKAVRNVSDTALWVAVYRAMESERPDALFHDPYARQLAGARGEAIVKTMPDAKQMSWAMVVRTAVMDEIILRCIAQGARTVLNLAAGLDTRAYRLDVPQDLHWYHVDLPDMLDYVQTHMRDVTPRCQLQYMAADLREPSIRQEIFNRASEHGPVLVITEGLLLYLLPNEVADLAKDLHSHSKAKWWLSDLASPLLLKLLAKRWSKTLGNAPFHFGPANGTDFFVPLGWRELEFRSTFLESVRLKRSMRFAWLWQLIGKFQSQAVRKARQRMSGIVLFESK